MRYRHVSFETCATTLPPHVVTSEEIETRLAPIYDRLHLPYGRLEMMSGIRERRFFDPGTLPGQISAITANHAIDVSGIDRCQIGAVIHGSVCRDRMEPATAAYVHSKLGVPQSALVLDLSNACLGLLNGVLLIADMIESGQIRAGVVVGTETGRDLVEGTIDSLLADVNLKRDDVKRAFASLTIGSGSAAIVLCDRKLSRRDNQLLGGVYRADTTQHELCTGGVNAGTHGDSRPRMETDSEALLHAGVNLAAQTWIDTKHELGWSNTDVDKIFTHQVGRAHRKLLLDRLELDPARDFPTVDFLGNTGAVALPTAMALGIERGHLSAGDHVALLGIGSGLNSVMLGVHWQQH